MWTSNPTKLNIDPKGKSCTMSKEAAPTALPGYRQLSDSEPGFLFNLGPVF